MTYKVINSMKTGSYTGKFGEMFKYAVQLEGVDGAVELSQKPDTPEPKAGDDLNGTIEETQYGKKFKKEQAPYKGGGAGNRGYDSEGMAWGNSLTNAVAVVNAAVMSGYKIVKPTPGAIAEEVLAVATKLYVGRPAAKTNDAGDPPVSNYTPDQAPTENELTAQGLDVPFL